MSTVSFNTHLPGGDEESAQRQTDSESPYQISADSTDGGAATVITDSVALTPPDSAQ